jgi:hypothetical protein
MDGALTPICGSCGVSLCWDVEEKEAMANADFWDQWECKDCNSDCMSLSQWRLKNPKRSTSSGVPKVSVIRGHGHPWDGRPGFDILYLNADTEKEMAVMEKQAKVKHWHPWLVGTNDGTGLPGGVFYKPSGVSTEWIDDLDNKHPGII